MTATCPNFAKLVPSTTGTKMSSEISVFQLKLNSILNLNKNNGKITEIHKNNMLLVKNRSEVWKAFKKSHAKFEIKDDNMNDWLKEAFWSLFQEEDLPDFIPRDLKTLDDDIKNMLKQLRKQWRRSRKDDDILKKDFMNTDIIIDLTAGDMDMDIDIDMTGDGDTDLAGRFDNQTMETDQDVLEADRDQDGLEEEEEEEEDMAEDEGIPGPSRKPFAAKKPRTQRHIAQNLR